MKTYNQAILTLAILFVVFTKCFSSDMTVTNVHVETFHPIKENPIVNVYFTISWRNSWNTDKNNDGAWVIFKFRNENAKITAKHAKVLAEGFENIHNYLGNDIDADYWLPQDRMGIIISPKSKYRGDVKWRLKVSVDVNEISDLSLDQSIHAEVYAIEMVRIPQGNFYAGEANEDIQKVSAAFFEYGTRDHYKIASEDEIEIGKVNGNLYYHNDSQVLFRGDGKGTVPREFPKGYDEFYIMKYELSNKNYVDFLNSIGTYYTHNRANFNGDNYLQSRGSLYLKGDEYNTNFPSNPCNFLSIVDQLAFTDWAGLRPITELEYEKTCRGPKKPSSNDYAWGTASQALLSRYYNDAGFLVIESPFEESNLDDSNLEFFGASYYWVMDLSSSLWERVVSIGSERGRAFRGTHGDGKLRGYYGEATNDDWPIQGDGGGMGYKGSGTYEITLAGEPEGHVGHRAFGAWGDGPRAIAYGYRAGRSR